MVKLGELLPKLFSKDNVERTKTVAESGKAFFDLAKAIGEKKTDPKDLQPYIVQISSLLDVLNSPWGQVLKEAIPFASLGMMLLNLGCEQLKRELSLEECLVLVTQAAYLASWQAELDVDKDGNSARFPGIDLSKAFGQNDRNFKKLAEIEIDAAAARQLITALPSSDLVKQFNKILVDRLVESGLDSLVANRFADQVAWNTPRYMNQMLAEHAERIKVLAEVYRNGGKEVLAHYVSIDDYLRDRIQPLPFEQVFDETDLQLREIYVPMEIQLLKTDGENTSTLPEPIEAWAIEKLLDSESKAILFIQGEAGRGKSAFCRMFADLVRRELAFTPILIRLREILTLGDTLTETFQQHLENFDFSKDKSWLTNKNQRFLFLLDGFDELILQGRSTGGLKEFIEQVEKFQSTSHHRILITGRPLAMQGIEKSAFRNKCLERVKLLPMNNDIRNTWLRKWAAKFGELEIKEFVNFLKACPADVENKLAREPLLLYMLARIHRDGEITAAELSGTSGMTAKVKVYDKAIEWVLAKQRESLTEKIFDDKLTIDELRQLLTEVSVCVIQSGGEIAEVGVIERRLTKDTNNNLKETFDKIRNTAVDDKKALNNLLTTFYLQPAQGNRDGAVEFAHKSFGEFLFAERIAEVFADWSSVTKTRKGEEDQIKQNDLEWQIYDLFGYGCLTPDIVDYLREMLVNSNDWQPLRLFDRLNSFWESWCDGEFIDRLPDNLPQKKMITLAEKTKERETCLGIRQIDVYTGLNVLILLLELHHYAQSKDEWKGQIVFYPSGEFQLSEHTTRLMKVINYSNSIEVITFSQNLGFFLRGANLKGANLRGADLSSADLSSADLRGADLRRTNLISADLSSVDLRGADLSSADLRGADLSSADLSSANLRGADLRGADLSRADLGSADLRGAYIRGADLSSADLKGADFSGSNLRHADLRDADWSNIVLDKYTNIDNIRKL